MKIEVTDVSAVRKNLWVEVDPGEVDRERRSLLLHYAKQAKIPGFRPGKVPLKVVEQRFGRDLDEDLKERLVSRFYVEAVREKGLEPLGDPSVEDVSMEPGKPFTFKTTFEVVPEFEPKAYRDVEVRRPAPAVGEDETDQALEELRTAQAKLIATEGRAAEAGDVVVTDMEGTPPGGEPFRQENMMLEVGAKDNLPAFNERFAGTRAGAELEFDVDYPEDYPNKDLAGRSVHYRATVREVKRRELPELDDEFAKDLGEFESLADLRRRIRDDLTARRKAEIERTVRTQVLDKVLLENPIPLPDVMVEAEIRRRLEDIVRMMVHQGLDPEKQQLDWKQLRERQEDPARKAVHARLVMDAVARREGLEAPDAEVDQRIREEAQRLGESHSKLKARLKKDHGLQALKNQMVREKSLDFLVSVANIQEEE